MHSGYKINPFLEESRNFRDLGSKKKNATRHLVDYDVHYLVPYGEPLALLSCLSDCRPRYPGSARVIISCAFCEFESRQVNYFCAGFSAGKRENVSRLNSTINGRSVQVLNFDHDK